jgi:hypothetical protein
MLGKRAGEDVQVSHHLHPCRREDRCLPCEVTESGCPTTNGVKHEFTDLFGVGVRIFLTKIYLLKSQRIGLDVLIRQLIIIEYKHTFPFNKIVPFP